MIRPLEKFFKSCSRVKNVKTGWVVGAVPIPEDTPSTDFEDNNILALVRCEKSVRISKKGWELHFLRNT